VVTLTKRIALMPKEFSQFYSVIDENLWTYTLAGAMIANS